MNQYGSIIVIDLLKNVEKRILKNYFDAFYNYFIFDNINTDLRRIFKYSSFYIK